ncbi:FAD-dependent oxidoreductase [Candidatus Saccharibacteria bacterium]|nr:FAD-dependent oxidoreductase [Candidatus Saccharibacteria bacterium]
MHVVVVGGGFGGIKAALELSRRNVGKITLISDEPHFLHHATLYSTATGKSYAESVIPLATIFARHPSVQVIQDRAVSLDEHRRLLICKKGQYKYDKLVLSLGSVTTFFGIPGMSQRAFGIKTLNDVKEFQNHIHDEVIEKKLDKEYFVIGAGPTGVELAASLNEYLKSLIHTYRIKGARSRVVLVEAAPRILPSLSKTASTKIHKQLQKQGVRVVVNHKVESLKDDGIIIEGKKHPTTTAVWTSGMANNPFFEKNKDIFQLTPTGYVHANDHLEALPNVYVIGDSNSVKHSGMAWPAFKQATHVAKQISRLAQGKHQRRFHSHSVPCGIPVGETWGYVEWHGVYLAGRTGFLARRYMELYGYSQLVSLRKAIPVWRAHYILEVDP